MPAIEAQLCACREGFDQCISCTDAKHLAYNEQNAQHFASLGLAITAYKTLKRRFYLRFTIPCIFKTVYLIKHEPKT